MRSFSELLILRNAYIGRSFKLGNLDKPTTCLISSCNFSCSLGCKANNKNSQDSVVEVVSAPATNKSSKVIVKFFTKN